jgi:hypothetical protein
MHLSADTVYAVSQEGEFPNTVGFQDTEADYCVSLARFSDLTPDRGTIDLVVCDQIHVETANLRLELSRSRCVLRLDQEAAAKLSGIDEYTIDCQADDETYEKVTELLRVIFTGLPGLTIVA